MPILMLSVIRHCAAIDCRFAGTVAAADNTVRLHGAFMPPAPYVIFAASRDMPRRAAIRLH